MQRLVGGEWKTTCTLVGKKIIFCFRLLLPAEKQRRAESDLRFHPLWLHFGGRQQLGLCLDGEASHVGGGEELVGTFCFIDHSRHNCYPIEQGSCGEASDAGAGIGLGKDGSNPCRDPHAVFYAWAGSNAHHLGQRVG